MIDIRKLKELVRLMVDNDLSELDMKDQQETVTIKRGPAGGTVVNHQPVIYNGAGGGAGTAPAPSHRPAATSSEESGESDNGAAAVPADTTGLVAIESPMVGTYYSSPNPDAGPFVGVGASIGPDSVVCLIEAMKVFNEIKAAKTGKVERILVKNGEAVEFGQKLFLVRP